MNTAGADSSPIATASAGRAGPTDPIDDGRKQKLDLLLHLLANLQQPIMIVGPKGCGKTALLRQVQARAHEGWKVCYLSATADLSLDRIRDEMMQVLRRPGHRQSGFETGSWLEEQLTELSRVDQTLLLLLDDADMLMPGLLAALWRYARQHSALRLAFALHPEDLRVKSTTDAPAVADSQVVHLFSAAESEPGKDRPSVKPTARAPQQVSAGMSRVAGVFGVLVAAFMALFLWREQGEPQTTSEPAKDPTAIKSAPSDVLPVVSQPTQSAPPLVDAAPSRNEAAPAVPPPEGAVTHDRPPELDSPAPPSSPVGTTHTEPFAAVPPGEGAPRPSEHSRDTEAKTPEVKDPVPSEPNGPPESGQAAVQPAAAKETPEPEKNAGAVQLSRDTAEPSPELREQDRGQPPAPHSMDHPISGVHDADWLMQQDPDAYTLQVVALSQPGAVAKFIERLPAGDELATFRSRKGTANLYPLLYGIYPSLAAAKTVGDRWPPALGKPYPRQLKSIQQEIRRVSSKKRVSNTPSR
jgi:DamX protein